MVQTRSDVGRLGSGWRPPQWNEEGSIQARLGHSQAHMLSCGFGDSLCHREMGERPPRKLLTPGPMHGPRDASSSRDCIQRRPSEPVSCALYWLEQCPPQIMSTQSLGMWLYLGN